MQRNQDTIASIENLEERQVLSAISPFSDTTAEVGKMQPSTEKLGGIDLGSGRIKSIGGTDLGSGRIKSIGGTDLGSGR